jgi:hypothetical protein
MDVEDLHPPVSPKSGCEDFFLGEDLDTQSVSAADLAKQIHITHVARSVGAEDFVTARDHDDFATTSSERLYLTSNFSHTDTLDSPFGKDALVHSRSFDSNPSSPEFHESNTMSSTTHYEINPAEKVYVTAKDVWGWGKTVTVFKPFLGLAEGVAGKVVSVVGSSLTDLDGTVSSNLTKMDDNYLNPALDKLVKVVFDAMQKTENIVKPVIMAILKPVGLVKNKAENPELTTSYKSTPMAAH